MTSTNTILHINIFGLGINSDDVNPFFSSDYHMPPSWKRNKGKLPRYARPGMTFAIFGDSSILATVTYLGYEWWKERQEHRGRGDIYPAGWVLKLNRGTWTRTNIKCYAMGQSYRYGNLSPTGVFTQIRVSDL